MAFQERFPCLDIFSLFFFRTVKFWDLETFQLVSSTDAETSGIRLVGILRTWKLYFEVILLPFVLSILYSLEELTYNYILYLQVCCIPS